MLFAGPVERLPAARGSVTGRLSSPAAARIPIPGEAAPAHPGPRARHPRRVGATTCATSTSTSRSPASSPSPGVSGSGKSSLVEDVLYRARPQAPRPARRRARRRTAPSRAPSASPRSSSSTRARSARRRAPTPPPTCAPSTASAPASPRTDMARLRGYTAGDVLVQRRRRPLRDLHAARASSASRCSSSPTSTCRAPSATARASSPRSSRSRWQGRTIREVLDLTVAEALELVRRRARGRASRLQPLADVGLDYLRLGQPLSTLSGGEAQRLKLAAHLGREARAHTLFLFDEPTTGLHLADIEQLLALLRAPRRARPLAARDRAQPRGRQVRRLGDRARPRRRRRPAAAWSPEGPPERVAAVPDSPTGAFLRDALGARRPTARPTPSPTWRAGPAWPSSSGIRVVGAREHNLRDVALELPRDRLIVFTGLSGSGKSSLAFDVLYAEGQRRYLDSLSAYARQFLHVMAKPDVDLLTGLPPTVAIEQRLSRGGRTSTVATVTEVAHYLRLLFAKVGVQHCPQCDAADPLADAPADPRPRAPRARAASASRCSRRWSAAARATTRRSSPGARKLRLREARIDGSARRARRASGCSTATASTTSTSWCVGRSSRRARRRSRTTSAVRSAWGTARSSSRRDGERAPLLRAPLLPGVRHRLPAARPAPVLLQQPAGRVSRLRGQRASASSPTPTRCSRRAHPLADGALAAVRGRRAPRREAPAAAERCARRASRSTVRSSGSPPGSAGTARDRTVEALRSALARRPRGVSTTSPSSSPARAAAARG